MNNEQWQALVRTIIALALGPGSYLVVKGVLTADQANALAPSIAGVVTILGGALVAWWSNHAHSTQALVAAVNNDPTAVKVVRASSPDQQVAVTPSGAIVPDPAVAPTVKP